MEAIETQWRIATESPGDSKPRLPTPRGPGISDIKEDMLTNLTKLTKPCTIYRNNIISVIAYIPFLVMLILKVAPATLILALLNSNRPSL